MNYKHTHLITIVLILTFTGTIAQSRYDKLLSKFSNKTIKGLRENNLISPELNLSIDSFYIDKKNKHLKLFFSNELTHLPVREDWLDSFHALTNRTTKKRYNLECYNKNVLVENLVPNYFRNHLNPDPERYEVRKPTTQHVKNLDRQYDYELGLDNKHIAIWGGHGLYYSNQDSIWQWQRPNLFTTVEDMLTYSFVVPYIIPMLEKAGANVYYPKERDTQTEEIIIDNDSQTASISYTSNVTITEGGFKNKSFFTGTENPFLLGTHPSMPASTNTSDSITYYFEPEKSGDYMVYISYAKSDSNVTGVKYKVYHSAGTTSYSVNQKMGYGTWVYLDRLKFISNNGYKIVVYNSSEQKGIITSDAIKIGGGYNRIERNGSRSQYPAYLNAGRYFLQYSGIPDSAVYSLSYGTNDYQDDYKSRGEWANYLAGGDYSKNRDSSIVGLNIPLDMSMSLHTDAGVTKTDSIIGTLAIHSTTGLHEQDTLPDGRTRYTNRDLTDIIQTEIINTIRAIHRPDWTRRSIWDRRYSEATYPNVPSVLIELLSHQNFEDMKYALNPEFKFDASRAIYKGIVKYIASANQQDYVISPLPVKDFSMFYENSKLRLTWNETIDHLEKSAKAEAFIIYTQIEDNGYDNGTLVTGNEFIIESIETGLEYSFKVTAVNKGGESFDSEILTTTIYEEDSNPVLIINGFEKTTGPEFIDTDSIGGFAWWKKSAIADGYEYSYAGKQYNFNKNDPWISNPRTGHGASYSTYEGTLKAGNTHDYPKKHGKHLKRHNISYISTSLKGFEINIDDYKNINKIDLIYGKQSTSTIGSKDYSVLQPSTRDALDDWFGEDKSILISGAFIASDVFDLHAADSLRSNWVMSNLDYKLIVDRASESGFVRGQAVYTLNMKPSADIYDLRSVDALTYINSGKILYRYPERKIAGGVYSDHNNLKKIILGFPPEAIINNQESMFDEIIRLLKWNE
ncbi:MAG: hypothetical protein ABFS32_17260 [Bacteroidota bacterium]